MGNRKKSVGSGKVPVCRMDKLSKLLDVAATGEGEWKQEAEQEIQKLEATRVYPVHLTQIILDPNCRVEVRILASTKLKKIVEAHWCLTAKSFVPPEIDSKNREKIKTLLLTRLLESNEEVHKAVVDFISTIVPWEWPRNWAGFIEPLFNCLKEEREFAVHGGLMLLEKMDLQSTVVLYPNYCTLICCDLNRIFAGEKQYSTEIRCLACMIFSKMVCATAYPRQSDTIRYFLWPEVTRFCAAAIPSWTSQNSSIHLKVKILNVVEKLLHKLPKCIYDFLANILPLIWETFLNCAKDYQANIVNVIGSNDNETQSVDHQAKEDSMDLLENILGLIERLLTSYGGNVAEIPDFRLSRQEWSYLQDSFILPHVLRHLIALMEVTACEIEQWNTDVDDFIEHEEAGINVVGIRSGVEHLITRVMKQKKLAVVDALTIVIMKHLQAENVMRVNGQSRVSQNSWQSQEAILRAFGLLKESIISKKNGKSPRYDVVPLLKNIVVADLNNPASHPLLVGRCLCIGGLYADLIPPEMAAAFLKETVDNLQENRPACVKICAAKAVYLWYHRDESRNGNTKNGIILRSHVPVLFDGLFCLAENQRSEGVLTLVLTSIVSLMLIRKAYTASIASRIYSLTETAMLEYRTEDSFCESCLDVVRELSLNANCVQLVQQRLVPTLLKMMTGTPTDKSIPKSEKDSIALEITDVLVENSPLPLSKLLIHTLFPACCNFVKSTDDITTLGRGITVIKTYLETSFERVIQYEDENGRYGAQYVFQVLTHVLNQKSSGHGIDDACDILIKLIKNDWLKIGEKNELFKALLNSVRVPRISQKLLMVYAYIINTEFDTVLKFLASAPSSAGQQSPLELVISKGFCRAYYSFNGKEQETMKIALGKIFEHGLTNLSSPLHQITFKEDSGQTIPLLAKICKIVINDQVPVKPKTNRQP